MPDALDYGRRVDRERPDNINVLSSFAEIYFNKLGQSAEKRVFTERMLEETKASKRREPARASAMLIRQRHDSLLTPDGRILPELLQPRLQNPLGEYNGAELQFLEPISADGGFPYGVPPMALAYNYYKRAGALMRGTTQRHAQLSDSVLDSRAAIALRYWAESENEYALLDECAAMKRKPPEARSGLEAVTADVTADTAFPEPGEAARQTVERAIFGFARAEDVARRAIAEYRRHVAETLFASDKNTFRAHIEEMEALADMTAGEHACLEYLASKSGLRPLKTGQTIEQLRQTALKSYERARDQYYRILLLRYVDDFITTKVYPSFTERKLGRVWTKEELWKADASLLPELATATYAEAKRLKFPLSVDVEEYQSYIDRAEKRLAMLKRP